MGEDGGGFFGGLGTLLTSALGQYNKDEDRKAQLEKDLRAFDMNPYYGVGENGVIFKRGVPSGIMPGVTTSNTVLIGGAVLAVVLVLLLVKS